MENLIEPCTNNIMSENDRFDVAVLKNVEEKDSGDETEVRIVTDNNKAEQGHTEKIDKYDPSLDLPIALRKDGILDRYKARVLLSVTMNKDWPLYQLDVKNAFLNGDLVEEVYMSRLALKPSLVSRFTTFVKSQGYSQRHSDHTLFKKVFKTGKITVLIVYVDDIVLSGDYQTEISQLKQRVNNEFEIKDLGNLKYFLVLEVARSKEGISVS
ncbi:Cysteine-rich RLK (receptor-like protein kinase) 8 [Cucumis melo var. makuwa]|uniref:Cysteine-rich RLK (Receptor-like protein kinase) 8 n=1 Tax=Cucumis melo var. makuwa TaxID=1194695 RepID=A0A5A7TBA1_CUCMM|nr:Cysteine-rich RLK (receptor-like protein kinase) 8 [Cucumis melo var. makuwa]